MGKASRSAGGKGERDVGRLMLQEGYLAWRTSQNRQSKLDTESDDVAAGMVPEHMRRDQNGNESSNGEYLDLYHIDRENHPDEYSDVKSISDFDVIPNLSIEVKNGYNCKTYNKQFQDWLEKLKAETPDGYMWALFWRRKHSGRFEYRVCYERNGITVITINENETRKAIHEIAELATAENSSLATNSPPASVNNYVDKATHKEFVRLTNAYQQRLRDLFSNVDTSTL